MSVLPFPTLACVFVDLLRALRSRRVAWWALGPEGAQETFTRRYIFPISTAWRLFTGFSKSLLLVAVEAIYTSGLLRMSSGNLTCFAMGALQGFDFWKRPISVLSTSCFVFAMRTMSCLRLPDATNNVNYIYFSFVVPYVIGFGAGCVARR